MTRANGGSAAPTGSSAPEFSQQFPEGLLEAVVRSSDDAIFTCDLQGIVTTWNPAATQIFGYEREEMVGRWVRELVPPQLHEQEEELERRFLAGEHISRFETTRLSKAGQEVLVSLTISPLRNQAGEITGTVRMARNITGQRLLDRARLQLAAIVESSDDAIVSKTLDGTIQTWNKAAERLFGYRPEEIIGRSILTLIPPDLHHEEPSIIARLRAGQRIEHFETTRIKRNGERMDVSLTISPIRDDEGNVIGASKILRDISQQKRLQESLLQAEKLAATGRMAASIAHEINNPLEGLLNLIYLARVSAEDADQVRALLATAEGELERVAHIARQTLGYYRDNVSPVRVSLTDIVRDAVRVYEPRLTSAKIQLHCDFKPTPPLTLKRGEITQVISNLVANSIHAMPRGGDLSLSVRQVQDGSAPLVIVEVRDTGTGIAPEHLPRVFEPFFTTRTTIGTGIGLWVARKFIEGHGGRIEARSSTDPETHGTTIRIVLPTVRETVQ